MIARRAWVVGCLTLALLGVSSGVGATPPKGPVTIETLIDFTTFSGTFVVKEGSGILGCSAGTFVDYPAVLGPDRPEGQGVIAKVFTCTAGGDGKFAANFLTILPPKPGPGFANGYWNVTSGTGDFARLHGRGDSWLDLTGPETGVETLTGKVHFD